MANPNSTPLPELTEDIIVRYWPKVDKNGPNGCWIWTGAKQSAGYGVLMFRKGGKTGINRNLRATHIAYFLKHKLDPAPLMVLHKCIGTPQCVNPDHLYVGTHDDNMEDKRVQGRFVRGSAISKKLTEEQVRSMRLDYENTPDGIIALSKKYGVSKSTVDYIVRRVLWKHVIP